MRSTQSSQIKPSRHGSWQPYIPQMGVATGCRPGIKDNNELLHITHESRRIQRIESNASSPHLVITNNATTKSSLENGSLVPAEGMCEIPVSRRPSQQISNSIFSHIPPNSENISEVAPRPHAGRITAGSWSVGDGKSDALKPEIKRRTNSETLIPPDNLGPGMSPYIDFWEERVPVVPFNGSISSSSSLGPGLIPVARRSDCKVQAEFVQERDMEHPGEIPYQRKYGLYSITGRSITNS